MAGRWKWSFHESGKWREAFVTARDAAAFGKPTRLIQEWDRPANMSASPGWAGGFHVIVPEADLYPRTDAMRVSAPITWCPPPAPDQDGRVPIRDHRGACATAAIGAEPGMPG